MKWIKGLMVVVVAIFLTGAVIYWIYNEPLPIGHEGAEAEQMADSMLEAINDRAWQNTKAIKWNFDGRQQHVWDRERHFVQVKWDQYIVQIAINSRKGIVLVGPNGMDESEHSTLCLRAWKSWANDSFWLNPISKIRDDGTSRSLVNYNGQDALMVTYNKGGVTPGDSYLWLLDEDGLPTNWKMWVGILPIGGISTTWENWETLKGGVKIATEHQNVLTLRLSELKAASSIQELEGNDIFLPLVNEENLVPF